MSQKVPVGIAKLGQEYFHYRFHTKKGSFRKVDGTRAKEKKNNKK